MKMNKKEFKQIILLIIFAGITLWVVLNYKLFVDLVCFVLKIIFPLFLGLCLAFIINVPMTTIETKFFRIEKKKRKKAIRVLSLILTLLLFVTIVSVISFFVIPQFAQAISSLAKEFPKLFKGSNEWVNKLTEFYPNIELELKKLDFTHLGKELLSSFGNFFNVAMSFAYKVISSIISFTIGLVFAIYILIDKEKLSKQIKKVMRAFLPNNVTNKILDIVKVSNEAFTNFLTGQCLEACILGLLFTVSMAIFRMPYAIMVGTLTTITALIPFVGAFISLLVGTVLIAVTDPTKALWFIVLSFALQQIEEKFIYPKVVGKSVGLPAIFTLVAITIGASMFGILGIIISVPISSIIYTLFSKYVNDRISVKAKESSSK